MKIVSYIVILSFCFSNIVFAEQMKVFTNKAHTETMEVDKLDCSVMKNKNDSFSLGWKFGTLMFGMGPEIRFNNSLGINWGPHVQYMIAEYQELCSRFNTGGMSQEEYDQEIKVLIDRSRNYTAKMQKLFREKKESMFEEMERTHCC
tara:strand:+ start:1467 stop:1907 length:441 start_codon:yes stop_codon:yes gene_type:complete